ncbi:MAG: signal recognition particle-docking protein FtsY [Polyangiales bacterium]
MREKPLLPPSEDLEKLPEPSTKASAGAEETGSSAPAAKAEKPEAKAEKPEAKAEKPAAKAEKPEPKSGKAKARAEKAKAKAEKAEKARSAQADASIKTTLAETPRAKQTEATEQPEAKAPEAKVETPAAPEAKAPEAKVETPAAPEAKVETPAAPEAKVETPAAPEAKAPEAKAPEAPKAAPAAKAAPKDLTALKTGLTQTRKGWMQRLFDVFGGKKEIDLGLIEEIEETMLTGDIGAGATARLVESLKARMARKELLDDGKAWDALKEDARAMLKTDAAGFGARAASGPLVILMVGVNGAGKTTTIAKLADRYKEEGKKVLLAAGDTFRAAAVQQLEMWARRIGVQIYKGKDGAKPSAVIFEALQQGARDGVDVILADTAGRLQTKAPLMEELRKIHDSCAKALPGAPHETLLVLDATTGQNAISQAREFSDSIKLSGVVLTKLDGTAKGGVILAVAEEFKLPVRFIGVGEKSADLREFDADDFVDALFARSEDAAA